MHRPSGAAWAALGRDTTGVHRRSNSNAISGPVSPASLQPTAIDSSNGLLPPMTDVAALGVSGGVSDFSTASLHNHRSGAGAGGLTLTPGAAGSHSTPFALPSAMATVHKRSHSNSFGTNGGGLKSPAAAAAMSPSGTFPATWRKVLYEKQPFEDNYVDAAFMQQLRTNTHLRSLKYRDIMRSTFAVLQQLNLVVLFIVAYVATLQGIISPSGLIGLDAGVILFALIGFVVLTNERGLTVASISQPIAKTVIVTVALVGMSPIFHTLTRSYSDDTIWALSILLGFVHVVFADYTYLNAQTTQFTHNVSMNAAMVAVVLLASRVTNTVASAGIVGVGILFFTLSPIMRFHIRQASVDAHELSAFLLCGVAMGCLIQFHLLATAAFVIVVILLVGLMPLFFVRVHTGRYKNQIQGPWDEAKPVNCAAAAEWATAGLLS